MLMYLNDVTLLIPVDLHEDWNNPSNSGAQPWDES